MKQNKRKKRKQESAHHKALFDSGLFGHKVERDRTKYTRKKKHKNNFD